MEGEVATWPVRIISESSDLIHLTHYSVYEPFHLLFTLPSGIFHPSRTLSLAALKKNTVPPSLFIKQIVIGGFCPSQTMFFLSARIFFPLSFSSSQYFFFLSYFFFLQVFFLYVFISSLFVMFSSWHYQNIFAYITECNYYRASI